MGEAAAVLTAVKGENFGGRADVASHARNWSPMGSNVVKIAVSRGHLCQGAVIGRKYADVLAAIVFDECNDRFAVFCPARAEDGPVEGAAQ